MVGIGELALVVLLEKVGGVDPEKLPLAFAHELAPARDLLPDQSQNGLGLTPSVGDDQDQVVGTSPGGSADAMHLVRAQELLERPGQPGEALAPRPPGDRDELVQVTPREVFAA